MNFYSQDKQDQWLYNNVFKDFKYGFFIDIGSHDGKTFNNTLFFEQYLSWSGINIEPLEQAYKELIVNRPNCININCAIDIKNDKAEFLEANMLSGLKNHYDPRHLERAQNELKENLCSVIVCTKRLDTILEEISVDAKQKINRIHYMSIDVEGAELAVLQSINFDSVFIDCIGFENNYPEQSKEITKFLEEKSYKTIHTCTDIFMLHTDSIFWEVFNKNKK